MPLLSIVIANYNYGRFLEEAIRSIIAQDEFDNCELIVVDGGSTDNSVEVIKKYANKIAWWCSAPDKGQSHAFNKGFAKARGKYLTWLNADDILVKGCLVKVLGQMRKHPECEWFTGNFYRYIQATGRVSEIGWGPHWYPSCLQRQGSPIVVFGPTSFFAKAAYERVGKIDESLHYVMDSDLWLRFMKYGIKQRRVRCFCWGFRMHEDSKTAEYSDHVVSNSVAGIIMEEMKRSKARVGYRMSRITRLSCILLRFLDGSLLLRQYLRIVFRSVA